MSSQANMEEFNNCGIETQSHDDQVQIVIINYEFPFYFVSTQPFSVVNRRACLSTGLRRRCSEIWGLGMNLNRWAGVTQQQVIRDTSFGSNNDTLKA